MKTQIMKKLFTTIVLFLGIGFTYSQNNLQATITGDCADGSALYTYAGTYNSKNKYDHTYTDGTDSFTMSIAYYMGVWVLAEVGYYDDPSFYNTNIPAGTMPPLTGWVSVADNCGATGTMTLSEVLATPSHSVITIHVYPNPSTNFITITHKNTINKKFEYSIIDFTGRTITKGTAFYDEKINFGTYPSGVYLLVIEDDSQNIYHEKLIINNQI